MELNGLKMTQLRKICQEKGIKNYSNLKKQPLVDLIFTHLGSNKVPEGYEYEAPCNPRGKPNKKERLQSKGVDVENLGIEEINDRIEALDLEDLAKKRGMRLKKPKKDRSELIAKANEIGMNYKDSWSDRKLKVTLDYALLSDTDEEDV